MRLGQSLQRKGLPVHHADRRAIAVRRTASLRSPMAALHRGDFRGALLHTFGRDCLPARTAHRQYSWLPANGSYCPKCVVPIRPESPAGKAEPAGSAPHSIKRYQRLMPSKEQGESFLPRGILAVNPAEARVRCSGDRSHSAVRKAGVLLPALTTGHQLPLFVQGPFESHVDLL